MNSSFCSMFFFSRSIAMAALLSSISFMLESCEESEARLSLRFPGECNWTPAAAAAAATLGDCRVMCAKGEPALW